MYSKKIRNLLLIILVLVSVCCKKYPEDDHLNAETVRKRLTGSWTLSEVLINGNDSTYNKFIIHKDSVTGWWILGGSKFTFCRKKGFDKEEGMPFIITFDIQNYSSPYPWSNTGSITTHLYNHKKSILFDISMPIGKTGCGKCGSNTPSFRLFPGNGKWEVRKLSDKELILERENINRMKFIKD